MLRLYTNSEFKSFEVYKFSGKQGKGRKSEEVSRKSKLLVVLVSKLHNDIAI